MTFDQLRYLGARKLLAAPLRAGLTLLGISLGVALFSGIGAINRATRASFEESINSLVGKAGLTVSAGEAGFPENVEDKIRHLPGVQTTAPMVESRGQLRAPDGQSETLVIYGVDLLKEQSVRTYQTSEEILDDPLEFLNQPDSIILTHAFAERHQLRRGDRLRLSTAGGTKSFTVRGLLNPEGPAKAFGGAIAIMDIDGARASFGKEGKDDRIDLVLAPGARAEDVAASVRSALGPGYSALEPEAQSENLNRMVGAFQGMLVFLSLLSLLVGLVLVANSVAVAVAERRREIGVLRALGGTRWQVLGLVLAESLLLGALAGAVGCALSAVFAHLMIEPVRHAVENQSVSQIRIDHLRLTARDWLAAILLGTFTSGLAALWPAWQATRIAPIEALKPKGVDLQAVVPPGRVFAWLPWCGLLALAGLLAAKLRPALGGAPDSALQPLLGIVGAALVAPLLVRGLLRLTSRMLAGRGFILKLSLDNLLRRPGRTATNVLTLVVGLMLVVIVAAVNLSFRQTVAQWARKAVSVGEMTISSDGRVVQLQAQPLAEGIGDRIRAFPGVDHSPNRAVMALRFVRVDYKGAQLAIKAIDQPPAGADYTFVYALDFPARETGTRLFGSPEPSVLISENMRKKFGLATGGLLGLDTPAGHRDFRIRGVVRDFASPDGVIYMPREIYKSLWNDRLINAFFASAAPGVDPGQLRARLAADLGARYGLVVLMNTELLGQLVQLVDESFRFNQAVELVALLVGLIGLLNTMLVAVIERTREIGTIRAVGMTPFQLQRMVLYEGLLQGGYGAIAAVGLGAYISWLWTTVNLSASLGWVIDFFFPLGATVQVALTGSVVAGLAGILPAWRASRLSIRSALEYE